MRLRVRVPVRLSATILLRSGMRCLLQFARALFLFRKSSKRRRMKLKFVPARFFIWLMAKAARNASGQRLEQKIVLLFTAKSSCRHLRRR
jgi:hypothetical protein